MVKFSRLGGFYQLLSCKRLEKSVLLHDVNDKLVQYNPEDTYNAYVGISFIFIVMLWRHEHVQLNYQKVNFQLYFLTFNKLHQTWLNHKSSTKSCSKHPSPAPSPRKALIFAQRARYKSMKLINFCETLIKFTLMKLKVYLGFLNNTVQPRPQTNIMFMTKLFPVRFYPGCMYSTSHKLKKQTFSMHISENHISL